jgi:hypothetical protein
LRLSAKSIKSRIRVFEGEGIFSSFAIRSAIYRRFIAVGVRGDVLARRIREALEIRIGFAFLGEGVLGGVSRVDRRISVLKG